MMELDWTRVGYIVEIGRRLLTELKSIGTFAFYGPLKGHLWWEYETRCTIFSIFGIEA